MSALDGLAARLGMRRSPSGLDVTGALTQPPQGPGLPSDDEPGMRYGLLDRIRPPAPDPLVFGPQYEPDGIQLPVVHCRTCGAGWSVYAGAKCWCCGKEGR